MKTIYDILDAFGGDQGLADLLGCPRSTVAAWKTRGRIPPANFTAIVRLAKRKRIAGLTYGALHEINEVEAAA